MTLMSVLDCITLSNCSQALKKSIMLTDSLTFSNHLYATIPSLDEMWECILNEIAGHHAHQIFIQMRINILKSPA